MSFRFNFSHISDSEISDTQSSDKEAEALKCVEEEILRQCDFIPLLNIKCEKCYDDISLLQIGDLEIKYILVNSLKTKTDNETFAQIDTLQTDIIPGKYEGGLKIWECSLDLALYLLENKCIKNKDRVLELGCGAGIPGIVAYLSGASVTFQDFNLEVLKFVTLPNTFLNTSIENISHVPDICQYLYGDWESINKKYFSEKCTTERYDIIITSETIYEISSQKKLLGLMKAALKPEGTIYLAAKIHYFGVGGGIADFEKLVKADDTFEIVSIHRIIQGVERQILKMKYIKR